MSGTFDAMDNYLVGWRDGYSQALDDVDAVIDAQTGGNTL